MKKLVELRKKGKLALLLSEALRALSVGSIAHLDRCLQDKKVGNTQFEQKEERQTSDP